MSRPFHKPVLLVEGEGDKEAVGKLIPLTLNQLGIKGIHPARNPIKVGDIPKLEREGELEKFVHYACTRRDGDSVLLVVDCDDACPLEVVRAFSQRIQRMHRPEEKPVGIVFFHREFETLFLFSLPTLAEQFPDYRWQLESFDVEKDMEEIRGAKEQLSGLMGSSKRYKPTRDQTRLLAGLDWERLRSNSRSFQHFEKTLLWLAGRHRRELSIYPAVKSTS
ncbi:MAG: DUF4276 family protein [Magnetococcales bacterium]|nr:DUF4276 family protein [Magnetococcales bacterium]